jgi:hypothetical protein
LKEAGFDVKPEVEVEIVDNGKKYGSRYIDILVDDEIVIELKNTPNKEEIKK